VDHFILLALGELIAGAMNALAGGGSFVSLPAMIAAGVPSVQASASSAGGKPAAQPNRPAVL
jgi:uncharacterized membrane protein YfcA